MRLDSRSTCNVKSPPSLTSTTVESLIIENIENSYLWLIIKNISPNYIFTTNRYDINCNKINDVTIFSQLNNLSFCSKVLLQIITTTTIEQSYN